MYLDQIIVAQKKGESRGITSICSAHATVLKTAMQQDDYLLIESTCNQVNQFGGYTGMKPVDFVRFIRELAEQYHHPANKIILGGDHLGPNVWKNEPAEFAMEKSAVMIRDYVQAGYQKIHLDCSMRLGDDQPGHLDLEISAQRSAQLAKVAEESRNEHSPAARYVIGTEVPVPGGAIEPEEGVHVTRIADLEQTITCTQQAFINAGIESAWERVIAVVVQPGVEFGDTFIQDYDSPGAEALSRYIENWPLIYEAHSTDYQTQSGLSDLVRDHFAILKVGPELTFAYREAVFALALVEDELILKDERSDLIAILEDVIVQDPVHWQDYYHGDQETLRLARKYSLSDRSRYYWQYPRVQTAIARLIENLCSLKPPAGLVSQYIPWYFREMRENSYSFSPEDVIAGRIQQVLEKYRQACTG